MVTNVVKISILICHLRNFNATLLRIMKRCVQISKVFMQIAAISVMMAVISVPLMYAMHTHHHAGSPCESHNHHEENHDDAAAMQDCTFCQLYTHYIPAQAVLKPAFTLCAPLFQLKRLAAHPVAKAPNEGLCDRHTNKGPPLVSQSV